ncbi:helicase SNF [Bacillus sp. SA1-12]|uniref:DEAD/DEAH box helicase n=1 Tax=Bacillus sp. SA1-12 TaxID=1455638 RepID=UPI00062700E9|nr:DEAD/DEAH box helicase [Bacillus sp. SA1-12]KKI89541.1 helicase SNF [Bacillus sp. SA1-12]
MEIELNQKIIEKMCGTVSFKRGDSFYRANKVKFKSYTSNCCEAVVEGTEDFHVTISKEPNGKIQTECSCPTLASFKNDCQHIAAVLLALAKKQHSGAPVESSTNQGLTEGLMTIFKRRPSRSSGSQLHFENRQVLDLEFICKPVMVRKEQNLFAVEISIGDFKIKQIRDFLKHVREGDPYVLSDSFTYDPDLHCFQKGTNDVIQQLIQVSYDERVYIGELPDNHELTNSDHMLVVPPSSWERFLQRIILAPYVRLEYDRKTFHGLQRSDEHLPLAFYFSKNAGKSYQLRIKGMDQFIILKSYSAAIYDGKVIELRQEDCNYLSDLKQLLDASGMNQIPIAQNQMEFFIEKVLPGLKRLGSFHLSEELSKHFEKTPLIAKLYLDRVKNRLLAGLEFHYGNIVINPSESRDIRTGAFFIRDMEKEEAILEWMEKSSFAETDGGYFLHNEELEYTFLYHNLPKLQKLVQVYATTAVRNRVIKGNNQPKIRVRVKKERTNWLEFKFEMDGIPDQQIRDVLVALEEKRKYYRLRNGSLLSLETREFEEIQRFLKAAPIQDEDLEAGLQVPIAGGFQLLDTADDQVFSFETSFHQFIESIQHPDNLAFNVPESLETILREYQKQGFRWMKSIANYGFGGILADDMGLGKTLQSIAFIVSELSVIRQKKHPVLIVCPSSLTYNWLGEIKKFSPDLQAAVVDGSKDKRAKQYKGLKEMDVIITSYTLLRKDIKWFEKQSFHTVFFDEAQAFKNPITQTARTVKKVKANHRFALTGTPIENSLEELWAIFHVVFPELFLGLKEYSRLTRKKIARRARPFMLRRVKEDVLSELPKKNEYMEAVELYPEQKKLYAAYLAKLRHKTLKHLDKDTIRKNRIKILAGLTRLRQICCHPALFIDGYKGRSAKFEQLKQIIEESRSSGRRVLIFSQFTKMLDLIGRELTNQGLPYFYLDGQTPSEERVEICHRFNLGERDLFLISLKAGGTGLNLTGADTVILYDTWWNPAVEEQAADRAHRMGQVNVVQVIKLVTRGTIEEKMSELQDKKRQLIEEMIDSDEKATATLTEEDIREILMM